MSITKDMAQLGKLVARHHGWAAAKAFKASGLSEGDLARLGQAATDLLRVFPDAPGAAPLLSAAMAVQLERHLGQSAYVVGGALGVEGVPVYPALGGFDAEAMDRPNWDGHTWVMIGAHIIDPSIFRAAYSADGPAPLARHVDLVFGPGKALFVDAWRHAAQLGFSYRPMHVFSPDEVTRMMGGAYALIQQGRD